METGHTNSVVWFVTWDKKTVSMKTRRDSIVTLKITFEPSLVSLFSKCYYDSPVVHKSMSFIERILLHTMQLWFFKISVDLILFLWTYLRLKQWQRERERNLGEPLDDLRKAPLTQFLLLQFSFSPSLPLSPPLFLSSRTPCNV